MHADLFFLQTAPQNQFPGFTNGKIQSFRQNDPAKLKKTGELLTAERDCFLNTLQEISSHKKKSDSSQKIATCLMSSKTEKTCLLNSSKTDENELLSEPNETTDKKTSHTADGMDINYYSQQGGEDNPIHPLSSAELFAFLKVLNAFELKTSALGRELLPEGSDLNSTIDKSLIDGYGSAALKQLVGRLQQDGFIPPKGFNEWVGRFKQFIANALKGNLSLRTGGQFAEGFAPSRISDLEGFERLLRGIFQGEESQKIDQGSQTEDVATRQKTADAIIIKTSLINDFSNNFEKTQSPQSTHNSSHVLSSENWRELDKAALETPASEKQEGVVESTTRTNSSSVKEKMDSMVTEKMNFLAKEESGSLAKEELNSLEKAKPTVRTNDGNRMASSFEIDQRHSRADAQDSPQKKETMPDSASREVATVNKITTQPSSGEVPIAKIISDVQIVKETATKLDTAVAEEITGKVSKVDGGNIDSGLSSFHNQTTDKANETASTAKEIESNNGGLRLQTMDQIVKKAVILLRNGQNEAKIDLKPDYLGHIRMQVITENHQVTVKILAEFSFVKDMIETHIQQLKAQLQQQGLEVDMLEVSISRDSDGFDHTQENASRLKIKSRHGDKDSAENTVEEAQGDTGSSASTKEASSTIDYFA